MPDNSMVIIAILIALATIIYDPEDPESARRLAEITFTAVLAAYVRVLLE